MLCKKKRKFVKINQSMWGGRERDRKRLLGIITVVIYREDSVKFL